MNTRIMDKDTLQGISYLAISVLIIAFLVAWGVQALIEAAVELSFILVGALIVLGGQLLFSKRSTLEKNMQFYWTDAQLIRSVVMKNVPELPNFNYLNIHYSRRNDTADNPHRPFYIVNSNTKKAYWVRPELRVLAKRGIIDGNAHEDEQKLNEFLENGGIELVDKGRYSQLGELI
jgi:hypothetical protein